MRAPLVLAIAACGALALAGCGSSETGSSTSSPARQQPPAGGPSGEAIAQLRACLKQHGVTLPTGPPSGGGPPQGGSGQPPQMDPQAFEACRKYLPQGGPGPGGAPPGAPPGGSS